MSNGDIKEEKIGFGNKIFYTCIILLICFSFVIGGLLVITEPPRLTIEYEYIAVRYVFAEHEDGKIVYYFKEGTLFSNYIKAWNKTAGESFEVIEGMQLTLKWQLEIKFMSNNRELIDHRFGWVDPTF